jgi:hypothetical protein
MAKAKKPKDDQVIDAAMPQEQAEQKEHPKFSKFKKG